MEIKHRFEIGYTMAIYGTRELLYEQMLKDIETLLKQNQALQLLQPDVSISAVIRSKTAQRIISETSAETKEKAKKYAEKRINCKHPREQISYIGNNLLRCNFCGLEFS